MQVKVESPKPDEQLITVSTDRPGRILLHWGVEGGKNYKGGWRLPGHDCRPNDTVNYKDRALQTPFVTENGNGMQVGWAGARMVATADGDSLAGKQEGWWE